MNYTFYFYFQIILMVLFFQMILLQLMLYLKKDREQNSLISILVSIHVLIFCTCEAYVSRKSVPDYAWIVTKIQHTSLAIYPVSLIYFWYRFLKKDILKRHLKIFGVIAGIVVLSIWATPWHQSGPYELKTIHEGSIFKIEMWDYRNIGPGAGLEMFAIISSYFLLAYTLLRSKDKGVGRDRYVFLSAMIFHLFCMINDILVWAIPDYKMFQILGLGNLGILYSLIYILSSKEYRIFSEAKRLNLELENTVRKRTAELEDLNTNLEEQVEARTDELMRKEAQISHNAKMESLGMLASGVAHDMNNILMGISGNLQMLDSSTIPENADEKIKGALDSCFRAKGLVQRLQTFTRSEEEKLHLENLSNIINLSLMLFKGTSKFITIDLDEPVEPVFGYVESTSFVSLLLNLFINAGHAMGDEGHLFISYGALSIPDPSVKRSIDSGDYAYVRIKDTGAGIPEETMDQVWNPFFTTKKPGVGTGLGLSNCREIIQRHGGDIWFDSEVGKGTTFHLLLKTGVPGMHEEYISIQENRLPGHLNIMLVEDRKDPMNVITSFLDSFGYQADTFTTSSDALNEFESNIDKYDLLLTDYALPGMNGLELAERCHTVRENLPVILFSGNIEDFPPSSHIEAFLRKPFSPTELKSTLISALSARN